MANLFETPQYIAIEGPAGAGKSALAGILAEKIGGWRVPGLPCNPFLRRSQAGKRSAAFSTQMWFLMSRYERLCAAAERNAKGRHSAPTVVDFIFEKDKLFACLNLSDEELALYKRQYDYFREQLPTPDLVIYLKASPQVLRKRLRRLRSAGCRVSGKYVDQMVQAYEHFFFHYTASDLLIVDTDDMDFLQNNRDLQMLLRRLVEPVHGTQYFLPLGHGGGGVPHRMLRAGRSAVAASAPVLRQVREGFGPGIFQAAQRLCRTF